MRHSVPLDCEPAGRVDQTPAPGDDQRREKVENALDASDLCHPANIPRTSPPKPRIP